MFSYLCLDGRWLYVLGPQVTPYEASSAIDVPEMEVDNSSIQSQQGGLFSWISGNKMISKVVEKTKSSMETMITTLDPGMKEVIRKYSSCSMTAPWVPKQYSYNIDNCGDCKRTCP